MMARPASKRMKTELGWVIVCKATNARHSDIYSRRKFAREDVRTFGAPKNWRVARVEIREIGRKMK